jgi:hypothetical protein
MGKTAGFALPTALSFVVITGVFVGTSMLVSTAQFKASADVIKTTQAQYAAETGIERAAEAAFVNIIQNKIALKDNRTLREYRKALLGNDIIPGSNVSITSPNKRLDKNNTTIIIQPTSGKLANGDTFRTTITRLDTRSTKTILQVTSEGTHRDLVNGAENVTKRIITRNLIISPRFNGLDYALLSNQINCSLCHTKIMDMETQYNTLGTDPSKLNLLSDAPMVKVASLRQTDMRVSYTSGMWDAPDTLIGGVFYSVGTIQDQVPNVITTAQLTSEGQMQFFVRNATDPTKNNLLKNSLPVNPAPEDCGGGTTCAKNANMYVNYPTSGGVDGDLVTEFPLPIYDSNQNRTVDNAEWSDAILNGLVDEGAYGSITGGDSKTIYTLKNDWALKTSYTTTKTYTDDQGNTQFKKINTYNVIYNSSPKTLPDIAALSYTAGSQFATPTQGIRGSVILSGTNANPLNISGSVYIDGDLIISGKVKTPIPSISTVPGGKIFVRGNIYIMGDLEYYCTSAALCDYSKADGIPRLVLAAGGNIIAGDYVSPRGALRSQLISTVTNATNPLEPSYTGSGSTMTVTTANSYNSVGGNPIAVGNHIQVSFVAGELGNYNREESNYATSIASTTWGVNYLPRYYTFRNNDNAYRTKGNLEVPGIYTDVATLPDTQKEVFVNIGPTGILDGTTTPWITEQALKNLWISNMETNAARIAARDPLDLNRLKPLQIDAILYSANSVFALARGNTNVEGGDRSSFLIGRRSVTGGRLTVNGAVVAADMGLFAAGDAPDGIVKPGSTAITSTNNNKQRWGAGNVSNDSDGWFGLHLNYDRRASDALPLPGTGLITELQRADNALTPRQ